jgi:hypothetical protein
LATKDLFLKFYFGVGYLASTVWRTWSSTWSDQLFWALYLIDDCPSWVLNMLFELSLLKHLFLKAMGAKL